MECKAKALGEMHLIPTQEEIHVCSDIGLHFAFFGISSLHSAISYWRLYINKDGTT